MADININIAQEAARRWRSRQSVRNQNLPKIKAGQISQIETPERMQRRIERLAKAAIRERAVTEAAVVAGVGTATPGARTTLVEKIGLERVLGRADFLGINFLETALAVSRFVGRIQIRTSPGVTDGYGTGFMVSPRLLLTNNHVLSSEAEAVHSEVEFDYQNDRFGRLLPVVTYRLLPGTFFLTSRELDFTLVAVSETSSQGNIQLKRYGWSRLIASQGKALLGDALNIVQHPKGGIKQIVLRSNQLIDLFDNYAHYKTDTEPGSSGSPVYNDQWEIVALHHSGVPNTQNGNLIAKDGSIWKDGMDPNQLDWVANEGVRVSSLIEHITRQQLSGQAAKLRDDLLTLVPPDPLEAAMMAEHDNGNSLPSSSSQIPPGAMTWNIPLQVTVQLGSPSASTQALDRGQPLQPVQPTTVTNGNGNGAASTGKVLPPSPPPPTADEAVSIDQDYTTRKGYDPNFLGTGNRRVPLPLLSDEMKAKAAINQKANGNNKFVLPYHHFSVVMNRERCLAFFTAVNVDGNLSYRIKREPDKWFFDPRLDRKEQTGNDVYANNPLDRGHLVRRLDPAWGQDKDVAKTANDDTFHFTNCTPQHHEFNAGQTMWAGLEDYILNNADAQDFRVTVFTGPVLDDNDPEYRGVQLPRQYWKVVVMVRDNGKLSATAYLLSQKSLIQGIEEEFTFGAYRTYQVSVGKIEELTGLDFGSLKNLQPTEATESFIEEGAGVKELESYADITY
jgi:endonuclease G, mitochondrial